MIRFRSAVALLLGGWMAGCGHPGPRVSLNPEEAAQLSAGKLWVVAYFPFKRFNLTESLLRPWGSSDNGSFYSLHGIWDPAPALEEAVVAGFKKRFGVNAVPFRSLVERQVFEKAAEETETRFSEESAAKRLKSWMEQQTDPLAEESRRRGGEYLLEVWVRLDVSRTPGGAATFLLWWWSRVLRLDTGKVVWCKTGLSSSVGVEVEDFREYAVNNLARFKDTFAKAAADGCGRTLFDPLGDLFPERTD